MTHLKSFCINTVSRKLNGINIKINIDHSTPLPCIVLLSNYRFKKKYVKVMPNGDIQGGLTKMVVSLIDFSFIRSLVASCYSIKSPPAYDPPSLFLLELFRYMDRYQSMDQFLEVLRDKERGQRYRTWAGITMDNIPTKGTFSNFKKRLEVDRYNQIFHILVNIFRELKMITFRVIAHDGTLFPTRAKYKGCTYFSDECACMNIEGIISRVRKQILYRLNNLHKINLEKAFKIKAPCPGTRFPKNIKPKKLDILTMKLAPVQNEPSEEETLNAMLFGVKEELDKHKLRLCVIRSNIINIAPDKDCASFCCYKLPKDTDAKIGVRRDPKNSSKKQKIFGYNLILSTSVEPELKLELPVAVSNIAGNGEEGKKLIGQIEQIDDFHDCQTKIHLADAKYDSKENYQFIRDKGAIPFIDYNPRNENTDIQTLQNRGYDENGWPYAPCGILTRPNGFDKDRNRHTFCCFQQCLKMTPAGIKGLNKDYDIASCPHIHNVNGFTAHSYIKDMPRRLIEVPRGTKRYNEVKKMRSAAERVNSVIKEDLKILNHPIVYNQLQADILAQITTIALLIYKGFSFIAKTSALWAEAIASKSNINKKLQPFYVPASIHSLIQLE